MKTNIKRTSFYIFVLIVLLFSVNTITSSAKTTNSTDIDHQTNPSYEIRPLIENNHYPIGEKIPIIIAVEADSSIQSFEFVLDGFKEATPFYMENNRLIGNIMCNSTTEEVQLSVRVTLENGIQLETNLFGFVDNNVVYINVNSFFGARDLYWSAMLNKGIYTYTEYETYITKRTPSVSNSIAKIEHTATSTTSTRSNITISGILQWKDDWGNLHPLQYTKVTAMNEVGNWSDPELGTTYTNSDGRYTIRFSIAGNCNPYLKIYPEGENTIVKTGTGNEYVWQTDTYENVTTRITISDTIDMENETGRAFQISQAAISASLFSRLMHDDYFDIVTIKYPHNENNSKCFYRKSEKTIFIVGNRQNDSNMVDGITLRSYSSWDVIQHEFFHHIQHQLNITGSPGGWHGAITNMYTHYMSHHSSSPDRSCLNSNNEITCANPSSTEAKDYAIKLTYAEAMASVLAEVSQDYLANQMSRLDKSIKTVGDASYTSYNGIEENYENCTLRMGEVNETSVTAILWDIFDNVDEAEDTFSLGCQSFWDIAVQNNKTLSEFITTLYASHYEYKRAIGNILTFYRVASSPDMFFDISLYTLPTFLWTNNGSNSTAYKNNNIEIVFYNCYYNEIVKKSTTDDVYTLSENEWNSILSESGDYFYWNIRSMQNDGNGCITGPYYSQYIKITKPTGITLTSDTPQTGNISGQGDYTWYQFTTTSSGIYTFYTTGATDTFGELFENPVYGLNTSARFAFNDDDGENNNFSMTVELDYNQTVYVRVKGYSNISGNYTLYVNFVEHVHYYNVTCTPNDTSTHRCTCNCGAYEDVEHDWIGGGTMIRCLKCMLTVTGTIPGGTISSIGNEAQLDTYVITKDEENDN